MRKIICIAAVLLLALAMTVPSLAATNYPAAINVPNGAATIDGIIEAGEWDEATRIEIVLSDILEDQDNGVPGAGLVGGPRPDVVNNDDIWLSVRMKVQDGYLYLLEERKDSTMQFTNDYYNHPYASAGSIIFFCEVGENLNSHDLFVLAETKSKTGPMFGWREQNDHAAMIEIFAEETKAAITANSFVLEAKIKLSDIGMTEQDMKDGKYLVTYCAVKITEPDFSGEPTDLWGENYQLQYKGVGPWDESVPIAVVAGAQWPPPAPAAPAVPNGTKANIANMTTSSAVDENYPITNMYNGNTNDFMVTPWDEGGFPKDFEIFLDDIYAVTSVEIAPRNDYFNGRVMNYSLYASTDGGASYSAIVENVSVDENISYVTGSDYLVITLPKTTPMNVLKLTVNESLEPTVIISNIEIYADSSYDFSAAPEPPAESPAEPEAPAVVNPPSSPTGDNMAIIFALMLCVICAFIAIKTKHPLKTK